LLRATGRAAAGEPPNAALSLPYEARQKRRLRTRLEDGRELALLLGGSPSLRAGDRLRAEDGSVIEVRAEPEPVSRVPCGEPLLLARACYHLGNRHLPVEIGPDFLRYPADHVLDALVEQLGLRVVRALEPFEPEGGAYAHGSAGRHAHAHGDDHDHDHDHGDAPQGAAPSERSAALRALLPLLRLASPALPIGAFAYSQGLEQAVERGWVRDEPSARAWIVERLAHSLAQTDVPVLLRMLAAWTQNGSGDAACLERVLHWSALLLACRESRELQQEDRQLGASLARLLGALGDAPAERLAASPLCTLPAAFARAAAQSGCDPQAATAAYLWSWLEAQVAAAQRSLPLGQTAAQRILLAGAEAIPEAIARALALGDDEIGAAAPGAAIASSLHEEQYSRLFRS
jgi:urease accessory protein